MVEAKPKPKRYKAKSYLERGHGSTYDGESTGSKMAGETASSTDVDGGRSLPLLGTTSGLHGLPTSTIPTSMATAAGYIPPKSTKRNATSPIAELLRKWFVA